VYVNNIFIYLQHQYTSIRRNMQLKVTPIYGSSTPPSPSTTSNDENSEPLEWLSSPVPSCTLVEYAGMKVLLNAGWDETLAISSSSLSSNNSDDHQGSVVNNNDTNMPLLPNELPNVDAILICDSTLSSLGGLPLYFGASKKEKFGRAPRSLLDSKNHHHHTEEQRQETKKKTNPPFLATYPTVKMGQMTLYDHHASLSLDGVHPGYSLEDVDAVFGKDSFHTLKYSQTVYLPLDEDEYSYSTNNNNTSTKKTKINSNKQNKLLAITPYLSGHVVGGCFWVLKQLSDDTEVVLAPNYHHAKEKHLSGSTLHKFGLNADALVTIPGGPRGLLGKLYQPPPPPKKDRQQQQQQQEEEEQQIVHYNRGKPILNPPMGHRSESEMIESIMQALRRDGNVLLPVDASGRVLELLLVLDRHWERQRLSGAYNLCWVGPMSINTIEFARSQLEWMNPPLGAQFDSQRGLNPYRLKNIKICSSISELESVIEKSNGNPTAVLASGASLDHGPARDLLLKWGDNPDNLVLLTNSSRCVPRGDVWSQRLREKTKSSGGIVLKEKSKLAVEDASSAAVAAAAATGEADDEGKLVGATLASSDVSCYTAASQLLYKWCAAKASGEEMADEIGVDTYVPHRAPLAGAELKAFLAAEEEERQMKKAEAEKKAMMQEIELARGRLRLGEDTEGGSGGGETSSKGASSAPVSATNGGLSTAGTGAVSPTRPRKKSRFNQDLFIKFSKPVHSKFC
jgi:cleavage and polyadenylation specificity factor subunit 2